MKLANSKMGRKKTNEHRAIVNLLPVELMTGTYTYPKHIAQVPHSPQGLSYIYKNKNINVKNFA